MTQPEKPTMTQFVKSSGFLMLQAFVKGGVFDAKVVNMAFDQYFQKLDGVHFEPMFDYTDPNRFHASVILAARKRLGRGKEGLRKYNECFKIGMSSLELITITRY